MQGIGKVGAGTAAVKAGEERFQLDEEQQMIASRDGRMRIRVFDKAAVRISVVEGVSRCRQLLLQMVDRAALPPSELASV